MKFYPNLNIAQHTLSWKLLIAQLIIPSILHLLNPQSRTCFKRNRSASQNKAITLIRPTNKTIVVSALMLFQILYPISRRIHALVSQQTAFKLFWQLRSSISAIHSHSTRLSTSHNLLSPRVNSSSWKCSLTFVGPNVRSPILDCIKFSATFTFKWKLKKHLLYVKDT